MSNRTVADEGTGVGIGPITFAVLSWRMGDRVTEILSKEQVMCVGRNELSPGECAAMTFACAEMPAQKPERWTALQISGHSSRTIRASYVDGRINITGSDGVDPEVLVLVKAAATGIEAACGFNAGVDFGVVEIEGARARRFCWPLDSNPYRNTPLPRENEAWTLGWLAADGILGSSK